MLPNGGKLMRKDTIQLHRDKLAVKYIYTIFKSRMPKHNRRGKAQILTADEIDRIIQLSSPAYRGIFTIVAYTGCRISEIISRKAEHLDLVNGFIRYTETKTGIDREVPLCTDAMTIITTLDLPKEGWLFPSNRTAGHVTRQTIDKELRAICDDMGLVGVSTHSFRRSLATTLNDRGVNLKVISGITGHKSLDQLSRYIDVSPNQMRDALNNRRKP